MTINRPFITVYRVDKDTGLFLFSESVLQDAGGNYHVPGNCVIEAPPAAEEGKCAQWVSEVPHTNYLFGKPESGAWATLDDYRKVDLFVTIDGAKYSIDAEQLVDEQAVSFVGYGALPAWLTTQPRPSQFHKWINAEWVLDEAAKLANDEAVERAWRDGEISRVTWLRDRHRDELEQSLPTTLTEGQYTELLDYIQVLRDWPAHAEFPDVAFRPVVPGWLAI